MAAQPTPFEPLGIGFTMREMLEVGPQKDKLCALWGDVRTFFRGGRDLGRLSELLSSILTSTIANLA